MKYGEYVRTKSGEIAKIVDTNMFDKSIYKDKQGATYYLEDIVNHSKNIIDLVEYGDFVNGRLVYQVGYNFLDDFVLKMGGSNYADFIYPNEIKEILTKEMYEQNVVKVVE